MAVGLVAGPMAAAEPATSGTLDWGVKGSFRDYVEGPIGQGEITMIDPAERRADGTFRFPGGTGDVDPDAGTASVDFAGGVRFEAHAGELDLAIEDLRLRVADGAGVVVADVSSSGTDYPDVDLVSLDLSGQSLVPDSNGVVRLADVPATLTDDAAPAFGGFYEGGAAFDPLTIAVHVDADASPTVTPTETETLPPTSTPPTSTPPTSTPPTSTPPTSTPPTSTPPTSTPPTSMPPTGPATTTLTSDPTATWGATQVSSGVLEWGVKESFRSYISGPIARGEWTLVRATETSSGAFRWTKSFGDYDLGTASGTVGFVGSVRFIGHEGALDLTLSRPRVRFASGGASLVVDVRGKALDGGDVFEQASVEFAALDLASTTCQTSSRSVTCTGVPATLTSAGAAGFGGFYEAGASLDPVSVSFAVGGSTVSGGGSAGGPGGALAHTGSDATLPLAVSGGLLAAIGFALIIAARRARSPAQA
jgi:hypothetical protein